VAAWLQSNDWSSYATGDGLDDEWTMSARLYVRGISVALIVVVDSTDGHAIAWWETEYGAWLGSACVGSS
jgi:hypothetical protein